MKIAELTADQAAALDPAQLEPDTAIAVRFSDTRTGVIGPIPTQFGPSILCGVIRFEDGWEWRRSIRVAPATPRGLGLLLAALEGLALGWRRAS